MTRSATDDDVRTKPGSIVAGLDGSADSLAAVAWAAERAVAERRPLAIAHAAAGPQHRETGRILATARSVAQRVSPRLDLTALVDVTDPCRQLIELSHAADVCVVGARGRGRDRTRRLGDVTGTLLRHSWCPVVVLRSDPPAAERAGVVADLRTPGDEPVLRLGFREAARLEEQLLLVGPTGVVGQELDRLRAAYPTVEVRTTTRGGARTLARVAAGARLVVVGGGEAAGQVPGPVAVVPTTPGP